MIKPANLTTVLFDMDGTLIRHSWSRREITQAFLAHFAEELAPITHDQFFETFWAKRQDMWHMLVDGILDGETATRYIYINTLRALKRDTTLAEAMANRWQALVLEEITPFAETFDVLKTVRTRYTTGIVTNGFARLQRAKLKQYNFADYVDFTLVSEETGYHKPDERLFREALQMAGETHPRQTLYIGDNLVADIQGAQQAGLTPIFINPADDLEPPAGVTKIRRLNELLRLLALDQ